MAFSLLRGFINWREVGTIWETFRGGRTLQLHFFCQRLTGGVSLDGCLLLSFLRVPAGEGSVTSDLTASALDILVLDREKHRGVKLKMHSGTKFAGHH